MTIQRTIIGSCLVLLLVFLGRVVIEHKNGKLSADSWQDRIKDKLHDGAKDKRRARLNRFRNNNDKDKAGAYYGYWDTIGRNQKKKKNNGGLVERYPASWGSIDTNLSTGLSGESWGSGKNNYKVASNKGSRRGTTSGTNGNLTGGLEVGGVNGGLPGGTDNGGTAGGTDGGGTSGGTNGGTTGLPGGSGPGGLPGGLELCPDGTPKPLYDECPKSDAPKLCDDGSLPPCKESVTDSAPTISCGTPGGSYLDVPAVKFNVSSNATSVRYCVSDATSGQCCNPENGTLYTGGEFIPGAGNGMYCVSAIAFKGSSSKSAVLNCPYEVDENLVSMTLDLPEKIYFQTQQLNKSMTVSSENFRSPAHSFMQVATKTDPGADACSALNYTSPIDEMMTSLGISIVNFADVENPFQIPMELTNKMTYGTNFLISAMERQSPSGNEYKCVKNTIYVEDFHLESQTASAFQPTPTDGTYNFQGGLNSFGSFGDNGEAVGSGGNTLEHGFLNIIN